MNLQDLVNDNDNDIEIAPEPVPNSQRQAVRSFQRRAKVKRGFRAKGGNARAR